jgi:hypothetical protein
LSYHLDLTGGMGKGAAFGDGNFQIGRA